MLIPLLWFLLCSNAACLYLPCYLSNTAHVLLYSMVILCQKHICVAFFLWLHPQSILAHIGQHIILSFAFYCPAASHHPIIPSSHHPIIPSSYHPIILSSHHPIIPSSHHPFASYHPIIPSSHHPIIPSSHHHPIIPSSLRIPSHPSVSLRIPPHPSGWCLVYMHHV
jgi:hypothetical protein